MVFLCDKSTVCPPDLISKAVAMRPQPMRLAIVRASAPLPMHTAFEAWQQGIANPILIGEEDNIHKEAEGLGWDISAIPIYNTKGESAAIEAATALVRSGGADALMKGHLHSDVFMGGIVSRDAGIRCDTRMVHVFAMFSESGNPLLISDAAVNVTPDRKTREQSLRMLVKTAHALGMPMPKIAIISATETPIASIASSLEAKELADWAKDNITDAVVSGPLSLDLAIAPEAAAIKGISDNPVAGNADALLMPEITAGNVLFKALVWYKGACAAGVVTGGTVPVILTSRADTHEARMASIALAALLSTHEEVT